VSTLQIGCRNILEKLRKLFKVDFRLLMGEEVRTKAVNKLSKMLSRKMVILTMVEMGPPRSEMKQVHKESLLRENPELTEADAEKLAEEKQYYTGGEAGSE